MWVTEGADAKITYNSKVSDDVLESHHPRNGKTLGEALRGNLLLTGSLRRFCVGSLRGFCGALRGSAEVFPSGDPMLVTLGLIDSEVLLSWPCLQILLVKDVMLSP